jgi:hypothetical protein
MGGLAFGLVGGFVNGLENGLLGGLAGGLVVGPASSKVWPSSLAAAQLAQQWHTPVRLIRFLDDAHERNVLRTLGPVYQFRHGRLQDQLAAPTREMATPQAASKLTSTPAAAADHEIKLRRSDRRQSILCH